MSKAAGLNTYAMLLFVYCPSAFKAIDRSARNLVATLSWRVSQLRNDNMMDAQLVRQGRQYCHLLYEYVRVSSFVVTYLAM